MSDQTTPNNVNNTPPEVKDPFAASNEILNSVSAQTNSTPVPEANIPPGSANSTVLVPHGNSMPKWFFILFSLVVLLFIGVTVFLMKSFSQAGFPFILNPSPTVTAVVTKAVIVPSIAISPSPEASDSMLMKVGVLTNTDEIADIETDIKNTDINIIDEVKTRSTENKVSVTP